MATALDMADKSFVVVAWIGKWISTHKVWAAIGAAVVFGALAIWRLVRWFNPAPPKTVAAQDGSSTVVPATAREFARESARKIAESLDSGYGNEVHALRLATEGVVLARVARELAPDVDQLSQSLGVNYTEYQKYSRKVLAEAEQKFR
jgi:hypothetical protein